ncbi:MAG: GNAT family N-acetyltransferase [Gemmatimonadaceae bacterium]
MGVSRAASDGHVDAARLAVAPARGWWGSADPMAEVAEFYAASITESVPHWCYIAEWNGEPMGFIQSYTPAEFHEGGWWLDEHDPTVRGIDQFLANGDQLGQGLGTSMVRAFVAKLFENASVTRIQTDPAPGNARAIRCYQKAGFHMHAEIDTPDGRAWLMCCERR